MRICYRDLYRFSFLCILWHGVTVQSEQMPLVSDTIQITLTGVTELTPHTKRLQFAVTIPEGEEIYHDSLSFSVDHPGISLSPWQASIHPVSVTDEGVKEAKKTYRESCDITMIAEAKEIPIDDSYIHVIAYNARTHKPMHYQFPLSFTQEKQVSQLSSDSHKHGMQAEEQSSVSIDDDTDIPATQECSRSWSDIISDRLSGTDSLFLQLFFAFILGLLLSLTPCIYPMIPITVGIIQAQAEKSIVRNFLLSASYSLGIALTYASLGFLVAYTGQKFGALSHNPFVIVILILLLLYLALSMMGFYEMYIPRFLQTSSAGGRKRGSFVSAFLFGALSGTVASPCLSPGLILLLSLAATVNKLTGFLLLLSFGLGLSVLLLCVGTFSGFLTLIPHSGVWMIEVKRFFGFIMLFMCNYFLRPLVPVHITQGINAFLAASIGFFYLYHAARMTTRGFFSSIINILGIFFLAAGIMEFAYTVKDFAVEWCPYADPLAWDSSYSCARQRAIESNRLMVIDITGPSCSLCTLIERKLFAPQIFMACSNNFVFVRLNSAESGETESTDFQKRHKVIGAPTILVIDPVDEREIARYGGELYDKSLVNFIKELQRFYRKNRPAVCPAPVS